ncbi:AP-4 complex accessory subunit tepsin, partial [Armadillidium nasatum]
MEKALNTSKASGINLMALLSSLLFVTKIYYQISLLRERNKIYPLLFKAVTDNETPISGYTYEEIAKISFQSQQHRIHLVDFFLSRLSSSGWSGKQ